MEYYIPPKICEKCQKAYEQRPANQNFALHKMEEFIFLIIDKETILSSKDKESLLLNLEEKGWEEMEESETYLEDVGAFVYAYEKTKTID